MAKKEQKQVVKADKPYLSKNQLRGLIPLVGIMAGAITYTDGIKKEYQADVDMAVPMAQKAELGIYGNAMTETAIAAHMAPPALKIATEKGTRKIEELKIQYNTKCETAANASFKFDPVTGEGVRKYTCATSMTAEIIPGGVKKDDPSIYEVRYTFNQVKATQDALLNYSALHASADKEIQRIQPQFQAAQEVKDKGFYIGIAASATLPLALLGEAGLIMLANRRRREFENSPA